MADKTLRETFSALADGIRSCLGEDESVHYTPAEMIDAIESLEVTSLYYSGIDGRCFWTHNNHLTEMQAGTYYVYGDSTNSAQQLDVRAGLYKVTLDSLNAPSFTEMYDGQGWYFVDSNYNASKGTANNVVFYADTTGLYTRKREGEATRLGGTNDLYWISNDGTYALPATPPHAPCYYNSSGEFTSYQLNNGSTYTYHQEPETTPYFVVASGGDLENQYVYTSNAGEVVNLTAEGAAVIQGYAGDSAASILSDGTYVVQGGYATPGGGASLTDQYVYTSNTGTVTNLTANGPAVIQGYAGDSAAAVLKDGAYQVSGGYSSEMHGSYYISGNEIEELHGLVFTRGDSRYDAVNLNTDSVYTYEGDANFSVHPVSSVTSDGWYHYDTSSGWYCEHPVPDNSIVAVYTSGEWSSITTTETLLEMAVNDTVTLHPTIGDNTYTFTITRNS